MKLSDTETNKDLVRSLLVLALAAIGIAAMTIVVWGADNTVCLTKKQAQAKWPGEYLYWHTSERCWDNVHPYPKVNRKMKGDRLKPAPLLDANGREIQGRRMPHPEKRSARPADVKSVRWEEYNELDAAADRQVYFGEERTPFWLLWQQRIGQ